VVLSVAAKLDRLVVVIGALLLSALGAVNYGNPPTNG
jgi:hypothetical protein